MNANADAFLFIVTKLNLTVKVTRSDLGLDTVRTIQNH